MHKYVSDILRGIPRDPPVELEFRIHLPEAYFRIARRHWETSTGPAAPHAHDQVLYNDASDLRRIGDEWQQKRTVDFMRVRIAGQLHAKLSACVESAADTPPRFNPSEWRTRHRERWSYPMGKWTVDWTLTDTGGEVELEFTGNTAELLNDPEDLCGLRVPMTRCISGERGASVSANACTCPADAGASG